MTPRWKIRREYLSGSWGGRAWFLSLDGEPVTYYFVWENALTHVDNWCQDQKLRGAS